MINNQCTSIIFVSYLYHFDTFYNNILNVFIILLLQYKLIIYLFHEKKIRITSNQHHPQPIQTQNPRPSKT